MPCVGFKSFKTLEILGFFQKSTLLHQGKRRTTVSPFDFQFILRVKSEIFPGKGRCKTGSFFFPAINALGRH